MRRAVLFAATALAFFAACSSSSSGNEGGDASTSDASTSDASSSDAATSDAGGDASDSGTISGAACTFNHDCPADQRCECDESTGCFCQTGARGTGRNGIDTCATGDDCVSSLCVEGPGGVMYCSDECGDAGQCTGQLPVCEAVAGIGMICVRTP